eukprot:m.66527 g.66527  ORF g.66527 m.66527 type:complete len:420 (-) comp12651_c0_seq3:94-1353(-)
MAVDERVVRVVQRSLPGANVLGVFGTSHVYEWAGQEWKYAEVNGSTIVCQCPNKEFKIVILNTEEANRDFTFALETGSQFKKLKDDFCSAQLPNKQLYGFWFPESADLTRFLETLNAIINSNPPLPPPAAQATPPTAATAATTTEAAPQRFVPERTPSQDMRSVLSMLADSVAAQGQRQAVPEPAQAPVSQATSALLPVVSHTMPAQVPAGQSLMRELFGDSIGAASPVATAAPVAVASTSAPLLPTPSLTPATAPGLGSPSGRGTDSEAERRQLIMMSRMSQPGKLGGPLARPPSTSTPPASTEAARAGFPATATAAAPMSVSVSSPAAPAAAAANGAAPSSEARQAPVAGAPGTAAAARAAPSAHAFLQPVLRPLFPLGPTTLTPEEYRLFLLKLILNDDKYLANLHQFYAGITKQG